MAYPRQQVGAAFGTGVLMTMKSLITAIQTDLKNTAALSYIADADIVIVPDEYLLPLGSCGLPAIGLKDGSVTRNMEANNTSATLTWQVTYQVHVIIYVDMTAGETPVIGQANPSIKGILDISADVQTALNEDYQSIAGVLDAYCVSEGESELMPWGDVLLLKKRMTFEYLAIETF